VGPRPLGIDLLFTDLFFFQKKRKEEEAAAAAAPSWSLEGKSTNLRWSGKRLKAK
jgi:hypothetical protein